MFTPNPIMIKAGFRPAGEVAKLIGKATSTVHRMVQQNRLEGSRDGRALYVSVESLIAYYEQDGNTAMVRAIKRWAKCG